MTSGTDRARNRTYQVHLMDAGLVTLVTALLPIVAIVVAVVLLIRFARR